MSNRNSDGLLKTIRLTALVVFVACAAVLAVYLWQSARQRRSLEEMSSFIHGGAMSSIATSAKAEDASKSDDAEYISALKSRYNELAAKNPDFIGWLYIEDTNVDYPVMHTPDDPQHYIHRGFDGHYSFGGLPFMDARDSAYLEPGNKIIYAHNMRDGSMFADIKNYLDADWFADHSRIRFDTLYDMGTYEAIASFSLYIGNDEDWVLSYHMLDTLDEYTLNALRDYIDQFASVRSEDCYPRLGDTLLTLSTCGSSGGTQRTILMARRVSDEA